MSEPPLIECEGLSFGYHASPVISHAHFSVPQTRAVCIVGSNGSGKTTLCKLLLGVLKPRQGSLKVLGTTPKEARQHIGYLPQQVDIDPHFPVRVIDLVLTGCLQSGSLFSYSKSNHAQAREALDCMGLTDFAHMPYASLSGGQKRRALIARALACKPRLLIMDEPTANVDPAAEDTLFETLQNLDSHVSVLLVSHQFDLVSHYVKHVICVHSGGHIHVHPTAEVTPERLQQLYGSNVRLVRHDMSLNS